MAVFGSFWKLGLGLKLCLEDKRLYVWNTQYGLLQFLPTNIRLGWKGSQGTNTLAYFTFCKIRRKKFITLTAGVSANIKFFFIADYDATKARVFALEKFFQVGLVFTSKLGSLPLKWGTVILSC